MFDAKELITYDITSSILMAEEEHENLKSSLRCYMDVEAKEFFIEISTKESMGTFSKSTLINIVHLAEENGAEVVYICLKKTIENKSTLSWNLPSNDPKIDAFLKNFMFLGFEKLSSEEQRRISKTKTHGLLKYTINGQEEQDDA